MQAPPKQRWYVQVKETYSFASKEISFLALRLIGVFALVFAVIFGIGIALDQRIFLGILGFTTSLLVTVFYFGKIAEKAAYSSISGQVGAAASVLNAIRGPWFVTPAVGVDKNQNMVHRVVGRPGIILVGEGSRPGVLLAEQRKAHARFAQGVPIHELTVGEGDLTISNLQKTVKKISKSLRPAEVTEVRRRLEALPKTALPIPKGPMPQGRKMSRR
ncbi:hypothetical protein GM51_12600 [freshwater metagenome]|uniref:DUF4191 domain-containing protein n=1 Tax=freshwater metagenome TaxID=449393 RepID=A0A094QP94_9ZZZZ